MIDAVSLRVGSKLELDSEIYVVVSHQHQMLGRGRGLVVTKLKSLLTGKVVDRTFRSGERVEVPDLDTRTCQFLYRDTAFHFMDTSTFDQFPMPEESVGDAVDYLKETMSVDILFHENNPIKVELPIFVELAVAETEPGIKGDTVSGATKPATLETGAKVQVPLFIEQGDVLKIDTRTCEYVERV